MGRQEILHRTVPPTLSFVIWEPALRMPTGGRETHLDQLRRLREYSELPGLSLQILPLSRTSHAGAAGVAACPHTIHVRDSKNPEDSGPMIQLTPSTWAAFLTYAGK